MGIVDDLIDVRRGKVSIGLEWNWVRIMGNAEQCTWAWDNLEGEKNYWNGGKGEREEEEIEWRESRGS